MVAGSDSDTNDRASSLDSSIEPVVIVSLLDAPSSPFTTCCRHLSAPLDQAQVPLKIGLNRPHSNSYANGQRLSCTGLTD